MPPKAIPEAPTPEARVRVCVVAPSLDIVGGQSVQADHLMRHLRELPGIEVGFVPVNPRLPGPLGRLQRLKYVRTIVTSVAYGVSLVRELRRWDVVHVFSASYLSFLLAPVPAMLVARLFGRKVLLNYHSGHADDHFRRWRTAVPLVRVADVIVVPSEYLQRVFATFGLEAHVVDNFIDGALFAFRERRTFAPVFLANRNFEPGYNVACVLRAFARVQARVPDARLILAGAGSQGPMLRGLAESLGLRDVEWCGQVDPARMPALYERADIYLNAPNVDNMPLSVLEAQMCGLPVVTTNAGGIPLLVTHDETGWLVACDDDAALADGALTLLRDPVRAARIARRARQVCEQRYGWPAVGPKWSEMYRGLLGGAPASGRVHGAAATSMQRSA